MAAPSKFDLERRSRLIGLVEAGVSLEQASEKVGVSVKTINRWVHRGHAGLDGVAGAFAEQLDAARNGDTGPLTEEDLYRLLERAARRGSVRAIKLLLERFEREEEMGRRPDRIDELIETRRLRLLAELDPFDQLDAQTSTNERTTP